MSPGIAAGRDRQADVPTLLRQRAEAAVVDLFDGRDACDLLLRHPARRAICISISFLAARNVLPVWAARFLVRRSFDTLRGVDTLIWALIWIKLSASVPLPGCSRSCRPTWEPSASCSPRRSRPQANGQPTASDLPVATLCTPCALAPCLRCGQ